MNIGHDVPHFEAKYLPPQCEKMEMIEILIQTLKSTAALAELKGIAKIIPNKAMLINAIVLQEAKDSSELKLLLCQRGII